MILYDEPVFRPPSEAYSLILQVTLGCSWNRCAFCEMYTSKQFCPRPFDDIKKDIAWAAKHYPETEKIFLADGDALVLSNNKLLPILNEIKKHFKNNIRISSYATPQNVLHKSDEELKTLRDAGLQLLYYGVESGDELILKKICKGATAQEIIEGITKAKSAGFIVSTTNLLGIAGKKYSLQHAQNTARVLSAANPQFISFLMVMFPLGETRFRSCFGDDYEPLTQTELIKELRDTLFQLDVIDSEIRANHASNYLPIKAHFAQDKEKTIKLIDDVLNHPQSHCLKPEYLRGL